MKKILLALALLCSNAFGAITDGKFSKNQIFDVQYWWNGTTLNASNFIAPYNMNFQQVSVSTGQYFQFFPSTTNPGTYGLGLYNSNGTLAQVVHNYGDITALGNGAIFYIGSGFFGNVISTGAGYNYGQSAQFTNMDTNVTAADMTNFTWASTTPLTAGQTAAPAAPVVTVTGTAVTYTTRTVTSGSNVTTYRTPVTTTTYSDGTTTASSGTESVYSTGVKSTVVTTKIQNGVLTVYSTPIVTNTIASNGSKTVTSDGTATSTSQNVQSGLTYQVWRYDSKTYSCGWLGCIWDLGRRSPSTSIGSYGNPTRSGTTTNGMYLATNARLPNGDNSLLGYNDNTVIRYSGTITAPITQGHPAGSVYRLYFYNNTDDGFRMLVNGQTIINQDSTNTWQSVGGYTSNGYMDVVAGQSYNIEAWYWNVLGGVGHRFYWDFGAGVTSVANDAFSTGTISNIAIDTTGVSYTNSSVVDVSGTTVSLVTVTDVTTVENVSSSAVTTVTSTDPVSTTTTTVNGSGTITTNNNTYTGVDTTVVTTTNTTPVTTTTYSNGTTTVDTGTTTTTTDSVTTFVVNATLGTAPIYTSASPNTTGNSIYIRQISAGTNNAVSLTQEGNNNTITGIDRGYASFSGNNNIITTTQYGTGNILGIKSQGWGQNLNLAQGTSALDSTNSVATAETTGNGISISLIQTSGNNAAIKLVGDVSASTVIQKNGTGNQTYINSSGQWNTANSLQDGANNLAIIGLTGNSNTASINQNGTGHSALLNLINAGGANNVSVLQTGTNDAYSLQQTCTNPAGCSASVIRNR